VQHLERGARAVSDSKDDVIGFEQMPTRGLRYLRNVTLN